MWLKVDRIDAGVREARERFVSHLLMPEERAQLERTGTPGAFFGRCARRQEAIVKGMGTGFSHGVWIATWGSVQNSWGKPEVVYSARGAGCGGRPRHRRRSRPLTGRGGPRGRGRHIMRRAASASRPWA